jgi:RNA polymerase sigma factor (sigma-70 family)
VVFAHLGVVPDMKSRRMPGKTGSRWLNTQAGFEAFYDGNAGDVLRYFARRTYDAEAALDLTAETFLQAFASRRKFRGSSEGEAAAWVFGIARHLFRRYLRRGYVERELIRRLEVDVPSQTPGADRLAGFADPGGLWDVMSEGMSGLTPEQRRVVELRVVEDLPFSEVASVLGVSEKAARMRFARAIDRLAPAIDSYYASKSEEAAL